jgi:hypothetical protein
LNKRHLLCAALLAASALAQAQTAPAASPAKKELVAKLLQLQQPGLEAAARSIVERPAAAMMQQAGAVLQSQVPADKREATGKAIEADVRKYVDEAYPPVRERALKLAPSAIGTAYEEKFSEDELKQLVAWFESPVNKKFQQVFPEVQNAYMQKLSSEARPLVEPKLQALEQKMRVALGMPAGAAPAGGSAPPKPADKPAARPAGK